MCVCVYHMCVSDDVYHHVYHDHMPPLGTRDESRASSSYGIRHCLHHTSSCFIRDSTYDADGDEERETKHEDGEDKTLLYPTPDVRVALRQRATH